jgi:hypothetical protein
MSSQVPSDQRQVHLDAGLLGIYLNDHLAGATAGVELARRLARSEHHSQIGGTLARIAGEIEEDRDTLLEIMGEFGVPVRRYKVYTAWVAEKAARLKLNGRLLDRSPLSTLVELEALRLGVEGKGAGWRSIRAVAASHGSPQTTRLDSLLARRRPWSSFGFVRLPMFSAGRRMTAVLTIELAPCGYATT